MLTLCLLKVKDLRKEGAFVPRRNSNARERQTVFNGTAHFYSGYLDCTDEQQVRIAAENRSCTGCLFAGHDFTCTTSDGECIKTLKIGETATTPEDKRDGTRLCNSGTG